MFKVYEILNPVKFSLLNIQLILTIHIAYTKTENIFSEVDYYSTSSSSDYKASNSS